MMLPLPNLDDRRWSDLAEEGRNLIPRYAPEWTDFNVHDPGITLIELLAWVTEMDVFQLNRIPASHRRKFMALLGLAPWPPQAAQAIVQFSLNQGITELDLPSTVEVETHHPFESMLRFRTLKAVTVVSTELQALWRQDEGGWHDLTLLWQNQEPLSMFGDNPIVNSAFYFGFSAPLPRNRTVSLYLHFGGGKSGPDERQRLQAEEFASQLDCPPPLNRCQPESSTPPAGAAPAPLAHHSVLIVWEFAQAFNGKVSWRPLQSGAEVIDETRACTLNGFVHFSLPAPMARWPLAPDSQPRYYLRCRLVAGEYDAPPILQTIILNAAPAEQAFPVNTQFALGKNTVISGPLPTVGALAKFTLGFNAAGEIVKLVFLPAESDAPEFFITRWQAPTSHATGILGSEIQLVARGLGEPSQEIILQPAPVQAQSVEIFTVEEETWRVWSARPDFDASSRSDRHFQLDPTTGVVTFGDGEKGLPAPKGAPIFARFRVTSAEKGNIPAAKRWRLANSAHNQALLNLPDAQARLKEISNPLLATGGAEAETLKHAEGRAWQEVRRVTRAVTLADIEHLALTTPGTDLARVAAKANVDARYPCLRAPGMITVILLPQLSRPGAQPSSGLRAAVQRYLNRRRIIGSRIEVTGPVYTQVTVRARVQSQLKANAARVRQDVRQALHDFFDPRHGGPDKTGWPFGRDVYRSEVLQVIDGVAGVENVLALELIANEAEPSCGNLCLGPCGLIISGEHEIVVV